MALSVSIYEVFCRLSGVAGCGWMLMLVIDQDEHVSFNSSKHGVCMPTLAIGALLMSHIELGTYFTF